ncbi:hypothetical protein ABT114_49310, partial [Streptomyces sp. NPDC002088]
PSNDHLSGLHEYLAPTPHQHRDLRNQDENLSLTATGTPVGTPAWMAPEQARGERVTAAADVYAWGLVIAFAALGRSPRSASDLTELPGRLREGIEYALGENPQDRPGLLELAGIVLGEEPPEASALRGRVQRILADRWRPHVDPSPYVRAASQLLDAGDAREAATPAALRILRFVTAHVRPQPESPGYHDTMTALLAAEFMLAGLCLDAGQEEADRHFLQITRLDPNARWLEGRAAYALGSWCLRQNDHTAACTYLRRAAQDSAYTLRAAGWLVELLWHTAPDEALWWIEIARSGEEEGANALFAAVRIYGERGQAQRAREAYQEWYDRYPAQRLPAKMALAWALHLSAQPEASNTLFQEVHDDPRFAQQEPELRALVEERLRQSADSAGQARSE